jgi:hypothetical protein
MKRKRCFPTDENPALLLSARYGLWGLNQTPLFFCPLELFYYFKGKYKKELNSRFHIYWIKTVLLQWWFLIIISLKTCKT